MTDPVVRQSLLPQDAVAPERAIEGADAAIVGLDVAQIIIARDPARAPAVYLPDLAWERSVDVWDPAWSDDVKRAVIEAAPEVHRHKGTVYAVKTALGALGVDADLSEWWQESPRGLPYTFSVTAYARARLYDGPLLDARLIRVIFSSVLHAKPESRAFGLAVVATFQGQLGFVPVATARIDFSASAQPVPATAFSTGLGFADALIARTKLGASVVPKTAFEGQAVLQFAAATLCRTRVSVAAVPILPS